MIRSRLSNDHKAPTEMRVALPVDIYQDLQAIAKASGLATSAYVRSLIIAHLNKIRRYTEPTP